MTPIRIWHASRDVYHCAFRMMRILVHRSEPMPLERLRTLDVFLLYPSLLHRVSLPTAIKEQFRQLDLVSPDKLFIRLPSTASIWQDLQLYQSTTLTNLGGRGILKAATLRDGRADLDAAVIPAELRKRIDATNAEQALLMDFLVGALSTLPMTGREGLPRRAALPARGVAL